jgi:hypothetical protein
MTNDMTAAVAAFELLTSDQQAEVEATVDARIAAHWALDGEYMPGVGVEIDAFVAAVEAMTATR